MHFRITSQMAYIITPITSMLLAISLKFDLSDESNLWMPIALELEKFHRVLEIVAGRCFRAYRISSLVTTFL